MDAEIRSVDTEKRGSDGNILYMRGAAIHVEVKRFEGLPLGEHKDQHYLEVQARSWEGATRSTLTARLHAEDLQQLFEIAVESEIIDAVSSRRLLYLLQQQDQELGVNGKQPKAPHCSRLDGKMGSTTLGQVRRRLKETGEFQGSWERFLDYLELPRGVGLTKDTMVAQSRRFAGR